MKIKGLIIIASVVMVLTACSQTNVENIKLENREDSLAYAIGVTTFEGVTQQGWEVDPLVLAKGMLDAKKGEPLFNEVAANGFITIYMRDKQEEMRAKQDEEMKVNFSAEIEAGEKFLAENMTKEGVVVTESGLQYKVITLGDGPLPAATDKVKIHYTGKLLDGTTFDSSVDKGVPIEYNVNGFIKGWIEGLQLMPVGSKYMFYIPYDLAYGARGSGATIKPYSTLVFEVELLEILTR